MYQITVRSVEAIFSPFRSKQIMTKLKIKIILVSMTLFFVTWNGEMIVRYDLLELNGMNNSSATLCDKVHHHGLPINVFEINDMISKIFASFVPMLLIIPANIAVMIKLCLVRRKRLQLGVINNAQDETARMNAMIFTVTTSYVILTTPITLYLLISLNHFSGLTFLILYLIQTLNPAVNAYLYFLASKLFRNELRKWIQKIFPYFWSSKPGNSRSEESSISTTQQTELETIT